MLLPTLLKYLQYIGRCLNIFATSLIIKTNNEESKWQPWGTPDSIINDDERTLLKFTINITSSQSNTSEAQANLAEICV